MITPRLMPGMRVGDAMISCQPDRIERDELGSRRRWRYSIDAVGVTFTGTDLGAPACGTGDDPRSMLAALVAFLSAAGEAYDAAGGARPAQGWMFGPAVDAWASRNSDELTIAALELDEASQEGTV